MAKFVFAMNVSLDGYVDHTEMGPPVPVVFRHFTQQVRGLAGFVFGHRLYEIMRCWDDDLSEWGTDERDYAMAWRSRPKWVVSRGSRLVGPNATVIQGDLEAAMRTLKAQQSGDIQVGGPELAQELTRLGLIDEYQLYFRPVVLGQGKPMFGSSRLALRLAASERIEDVMRMTYVPV